jgi:hypothetical protein
MTRFTRALAASLAIMVSPLVSVYPGDAASPTIPTSEVKGRMGDLLVQTAALAPATGGDGDTPFFARLPDGATCPGDSANDQWRVNTFVIPAAEDPLKLEFAAGGPEPVWQDHFALFDVGTRTSVINQFLVKNETAGNPGVIKPLPQLFMAPIAENGFTAGRYRLGVACTFWQQTTQYWDVDIEMTSSQGANGVGTMSWNVVGTMTAPSAGATSDNSPTPLIIALLAAAVGAAFFVVIRRSRRSANP